MPYGKAFYHLVWATKGRQPMLIGEVAKMVESSVRATCRQNDVLVRELFVMPDHVHLAVSGPPTLSISKLVGNLKGSSSHLVRHAKTHRDESFAWQSEYGFVTFGERNLPEVVDYIRNQPERHARRETWSKLEQTTERTTADSKRIDRDPTSDRTLS